MLNEEEIRNDQKKQDLDLLARSYTSGYNQAVDDIIHILSSIKNQ